MIAYLKGGTSNLVYTVLYKLKCLGYLDMSKDARSFRRNKFNSPVKGSFSAIENFMYLFFKTSVSVSSLGVPEMTNKIRKTMESQPMIQQYPSLVFTEEERLTAKGWGTIIKIGAGVGSVILGFMFANFFAFMLPFALIFVVVAVVCKLPGNTKNGEQYLAQVTALNPLNVEQFSGYTTAQQILFVALSAETVFPVIGWKPVMDNYKVGNSSSGGVGSGCASGCSSGCSGDGGGGCGGGCGGCGGGD